MKKTVRESGRFGIVRLSAGTGDLMSAKVHSGMALKSVTMREIIDAT
jgi:hypothetical protein